MQRGKSLLSIRLWNIKRGEKKEGNKGPVTGTVLPLYFVSLSHKFT